MGNEELKYMTTTEIKQAIGAYNQVKSLLQGVFLAKEEIIWYEHLEQLEDELSIRDDE